MPVACGGRITVALRSGHIQRCCSAAQRRMVRHPHCEAERINGGADWPFGLAECQAEYGSQGQRCQDCQRGIPGLAAAAAARLRCPCRDRDALPYCLCHCVQRPGTSPQSTTAQLFEKKALTLWGSSHAPNVAHARTSKMTSTRRAGFQRFSSRTSLSQTGRIWQRRSR